jgi:hypothetical protein
LPVGWAGARVATPAHIAAARTANRRLRMAI